MSGSNNTEHVRLSSYVPDFDVFLSDCEVPSPSNLYGNSLFMEPPDYSLSGYGNGIDDSAYSKFSPISSDKFYDNVDQKQNFQEFSQQMSQIQSPMMADPFNDNDYGQCLDDFSSSLLYGNVETTHVDLFAASLLGGTSIKKEVTTIPTQNEGCDVQQPHPNTMQTMMTNCDSSSVPYIKSEIMDDQQDDCCSNGGADSGDFDNVQSLVLQQLTQDIELTCETLHISSDPYKWSVEDVQSWLMWTLRQYHLPQISLEYFVIDGPTICSLLEDDFRQLTTEHGDILYAQLEIWKTAVLFRRQRTTTAALPPQQQQQQQSSAMYKLEDLDSYTAYASPTSDSQFCSTPDRQSSPPAACVPDIISHQSSDYSSDGGIQSDDDISDDGQLGETNTADKITKPSTSGQRLTHNGHNSSSHSHIHLWQFLKELLVSPQPQTSNCIRWLDRTKGVFKIEDSVRVARLWGKRKNRPAMNYDKLSRSIRQYYKKGIMKKTERSQRLVYQFCHPYCL